MGAYVATTGFNAAKVFVAGAAVGVFAFEGYNMLTRDACGSVCIIPFSRLRRLTPAQPILRAQQSARASVPSAECVKAQQGWKIS